jgi:hypothetical protein
MPPARIKALVASTLHNSVATGVTGACGMPSLVCHSIHRLSPPRLFLEPTACLKCGILTHSPSSCGLCRAGHGELKTFTLLLRRFLPKSEVTAASPCDTQTIIARLSNLEGTRYMVCYTATIMCQRRVLSFNAQQSLPEEFFRPSSF